MFFVILFLLADFLPTGEHTRAEHAAKKLRTFEKISNFPSDLISGSKPQKSYKNFTTNYNNLYYPRKHVKFFEKAQNSVSTSYAHFFKNLSTESLPAHMGQHDKSIIFEIYKLFDIDDYGVSDFAKTNSTPLNKDDRGTPLQIFKETKEIFCYIINYQKDRKLSTITKGDFLASKIPQMSSFVSEKCTISSEGINSQFTRCKHYFTFCRLLYTNIYKLVEMFTNIYNCLQTKQKLCKCFHTRNVISINHWAHHGRNAKT